MSPFSSDYAYFSNIGLAGKKHFSAGLGDICSNLVLIMSRIKLTNASLLLLSGELEFYFGFRRKEENNSICHD